MVLTLALALATLEVPSTDIEKNGGRHQRSSGQERGDMEDKEVDQKSGSSKRVGIEVL